MASSGEICLEDTSAFSYRLAHHREIRCRRAYLSSRGLASFWLYGWRLGLFTRIPRIARATLLRCRSRDALCRTLAVKGALAHTVCRGKVRSTSDVGIYRRFHEGERNVATWQPRPTLGHALGILLVRFMAIVHSISTCDDL